jgi:hypothetical protein
MHIIGISLISLRVKIVGDRTSGIQNSQFVIIRFKPFVILLYQKNDIFFDINAITHVTILCIPTPLSSEE